MSKLKPRTSVGAFGNVGSLEFDKHKGPLNSGGHVRIREDPARIRGRLNSARAVRIHPALRIRRRGLNSEGARIRGHPPNSGHGPNSDGPSRIRRTTNSGTPPEFRPPPSEFGPPTPPEFGQHPRIRRHPQIWGGASRIQKVLNSGALPEFRPPPNSEGASRIRAIPRFQMPPT